MLTKSSVIFPAVVASAFSSNSVRSSKKLSTLAALSVPRPRSIMLAPSEKKPLGMAMVPDIRPAKIDSSVPTSLFDSTPCFNSVALKSLSAIRPPNQWLLTLVDLLFYHL